MKKYEIAKKRRWTPEIGQIRCAPPVVATRQGSSSFCEWTRTRAHPLTISSAENDLVTVIFQKIGGTTLALDRPRRGLPARLVGPLGVLSTHVE